MDIFHLFSVEEADVDDDILCLNEGRIVKLALALIFQNQEFFPGNTVS